MNAQRVIVGMVSVAQKSNPVEMESNGIFSPSHVNALPEHIGMALTATNQSSAEEGNS